VEKSRDRTLGRWRYVLVRGRLLLRNTAQAVVGGVLLISVHCLAGEHDQKRVEGPDGFAALIAQRVGQLRAALQMHLTGCGGGRRRVAGRWGIDGGGLGCLTESN
jgi:hypothetical protein